MDAVTNSNNRRNVPLVYLTRVERFSSAHRLHNRAWNESRNKLLFGKCDNVHGHNYQLEVTVKGPVDIHTGMVINITELKQIIEHSVLALLDHKNIDQDVGYFQENGQISSSENLCVFIWEQIYKELPSPVQLHRIKLHETDKNIVEYYGEHC